ncbi:MAG: hypothetical protein UU66_C0016G0002 [Parcubacteria group bacterium GW2011_GWB1_41_5]|nr:MAG: hypothetical protein UU66_C0016G0002 [Parcubacteria group bacterium GW2011_GWB1_41_5]KKS33455.1 MAG: hypothetical protein UU96_C0023G0008 [Parcubacteria group bacterium GW2011_GWC2_42_13]KKS56454.1 MAG: hypothetical protein UV22_C0031G0003 [Parcubacteria group bacterium GW2011_GWA2_42_35]
MEQNVIIAKSLKSVELYALKKKIMRKVYLIWFLRRISSPFLVKTFFLTAALAEASFYFSLPDIFKNIFLASGNFPTLSGFMIASFQHTDAISKLFFMGLMFLIGLFLHQLYISLYRRKQQEILQQV